MSGPEKERARSEGGGFSRLVASPAFKFIILGVLTLVLMIPLLLVYLIVDERQSYSRQAVNEVGRKWGREQAFHGPYMVIPMDRTVERTDRQGNKSSYREVKYAVLLPKVLNIKSDVQAKELQRGIYDVPVYKTQVSYSGKFDPADLEQFRRDRFELRVNEAVFTVLISDVRGIKKTTDVMIGTKASTFQAGVGIKGQRTNGVHIPLSSAQLSDGFEFKFELPVNGTKHLLFEPSGAETKLDMSSNWPHPSFTGNFLPNERDISAQGFKADWHVPHLARGMGQSHTQTNIKKLMPNNLFGVQFYQPVGFYDLVSRALKYAVAFISAVFLMVYIMEVYVGRPIHWIQYVFVGFSLLIFYLVLLGLAEHIGFEFSYGLASTATALLVGLYTSSTLRSKAKGLVLGLMILMIYGLLYLLLRVEDYALLIGSLAGFAMLSGVMYMTRNVDWSGYQSEANRDN